jgi:epoxide hydrolase-like predicted phosphatase
LSGAGARRVEAVISDFGGVLTTPLFHAFARFQADHGIPLDALGQAMVLATERRGGENPLYALERGEMREAEFLGLVEDALAEVAGRRIHMDGFAERYFAHLHVNDEMLAYLRSLKDERGLRLALLTNNVREWEPKWRSMIPIDTVFETVVDSAFVGMRKPERGIYELTLDRLGLPGEACVFVDDIEVNCDGARALGIHAVHFDTTGQTVADVEALLGT